MKKLLALLLAVVMVFALAACGGEETETTEKAKKTETKETETKETETTTETEEVTIPEETQPKETGDETHPEENIEVTQPEEETEVTAMTFEEFMAAEEETEVVVECAIQNNQSWWDNKITIYAADENGGYFLYELACPEEDAAKLTQGTWIRVTGIKKSWEGMIEIMDGTFEFIEKDAYIAEAVDVTELLGNDEELINKTALPVIFTGMTVETVEFKNGEPGDDIYVTVKSGDTSYNFCVELYLTGPDTDVYKAVSALKAGDVIDITAYLYWYNGINPHIVAVTAA